eukprot:10151.XXX_210636_211202_1 [CDS] Oithona nana genome sequencing.
MPILYCLAFLLGFLRFQGCEALKCLEEIPGQQPLHTINCAYFAFGNAQVCYSIKKMQDFDGQSLGFIRGCQYLTRLGINVGPIKNLTEESACELRKPNQDELVLDHRLKEVEVCVCVQDLCNTYNNGANSTKQPILLSSIENKATTFISVHFILQILSSFLLS